MQRKCSEPATGSAEKGLAIKEDVEETELDSRNILPAARTLPV